MADNNKPSVRLLQRRGSGLCIVVPKSMLDRLAWNRNDALALVIVQDALVVKKVSMPKLPDLMRAGNAN